MGGLTVNTLWGIYARWAHRVADRSKLAGATLSNRVVLIRRRGPYTKKPHCVQWGFFVYGALGWIRTTDRPVRSRVLYPAELRVLCCLLSEAAYYRGAGRLCQQSLRAFRGFFYALF